MLKTLCAMLILISAANAHAQARINNMDARKFREATMSIMKSEMQSKPRLNDRIALLRQTFFSHNDRHTPATQVMFVTAHQLMAEESAAKTAKFKSSKDGAERVALANDIKLINEALRIYDFAQAPSGSGSSKSNR